MVASKFPEFHHDLKATNVTAEQRAIKLAELAAGEFLTPQQLAEIQKECSIDLGGGTHFGSPAATQVNSGEASANAEPNLVGDLLGSVEGAEIKH
jgi:hypothetical protein